MADLSSKGKIRHTTETFITTANKIYDNKYNYSKVEYKNNNTKITIICDIHKNEYEQLPRTHLQGYNGCKDCGKIKRIIKKETVGIITNSDQFFARANEIHNNRYDYSETKYINSTTKINIKCTVHGIFEQSPSNHLSGAGCNQCVKDTEKYTTEEFIVQAKKVHGDKYNYEKVKYVNNKTKVIVICNEHDDPYEFDCLPANHLRNHGCPKCADLTNAHTLDKFIELSKNVHGNKYDYSEVQYVNSYTKVTIKCKVHSNFIQEPRGHLKGYGCHKCAIDKIKNLIKSYVKYTKDDFINSAKKIHGDLYDYSNVEYINLSTKVSITCKSHSDFLQTPSSHLSGSGCLKCANIKQKYTTDDFIRLSTKTHGDKYDYTNTLYVDYQTKVSINCRKSNHGAFLQTPYNHMMGQGCPRCNESRGETKIAQYLSEHEISFVRQKKYVECKNKICLPFDFYLTDLNILIEYDGIGHFLPIKAFGGEEAFKYRRNNDAIKNKFTQDNNIKLLRIKYNEKINEKLDELFISL